MSARGTWSRYDRCPPLYVPLTGKRCLLLSYCSGFDALAVPTIIAPRTNNSLPGCVSLSISRASYFLSHWLSYTPCSRTACILCDDSRASNHARCPFLTFVQWHRVTIPMLVCWSHACLICALSPHIDWVRLLFRKNWEMQCSAPVPDQRLVKTNRRTTSSCCSEGVALCVVLERRAIACR